MKKILNEPITYFLGYILMIVLTFGHVYNHFPNSYSASWSDKEIQYGLLEKTLGSVVPSVMWPFYWSARMWR